MFFEGVLISLIIIYIIPAGNNFESIISDPTLSSDLIVYGLLPALLFGETMNLNWHDVWSGVNQYMLLAGPGAIFGAFLTAVFAKYLLPYNWSWQICFLFGATLSATDPVSVIAVLKSTGASNKLSTIITGESLFNDGSAMVLFFLFYDESVYFANAGNFFSFVFKMTLASPAIGIGLGILSHKLMRFFDTPTNSHIDLQIAITLSCAYASFYIAEGPCGISGVLSCCAAGLVLAQRASPKILDNEKLHSVWSILEWFCNTLIFFLAGLIAGANPLQKSTGSIDNDFLSLFIMFFAIIFIRYLMILIFYPILKNIGFGLTINEALFVGFSGLRGALGISLSLIVQSNFSDAPSFFFLFAGIASLTLLLNGSFAALFIRKLGLVDDPNAPKSPELILALKQIKRSIRLTVQDELALIETELGDYNRAEVNNLCRIMRGSQDLGDLLSDPTQIHSLKRFTIDSNHISKDLLTYVRITFLDTLKARYWDSIRNGKLGIHAYSAKLLLHTIDVAYDHVHDKLADWDSVEEGLLLDRFSQILYHNIDNFFELFHYSSGYLSHLVAKRERMTIYTLLNFIDAHQFAQSKLTEFLGQDNIQIELEKDSKTENVIGPELSQLKSESMASVSS